MMAPFVLEVRTLTGALRHINDMTADSTLAQLAASISIAMDVPVSLLRLIANHEIIFNPRPRDDVRAPTTTLRAAGLVAGSIVHMVYAL